MNKSILLLALLMVSISYANAVIYCYFCANCPQPFTPNSPLVSVASGNTGFCAKKSYSADPNAPNSRGVADPGLCVVNGCRWVYDPSGRQVYTCCCNSNYCNGSMSVVCCKLLLIIILFQNYIHGYPTSYCIRFDTNVPGAKDPIIINVTQNWAPLGANHLFDVINSQFYSVPAAFFRVVPNFVVQFGISGEPLQNIIWNKSIQDDSVKKSNVKGTISYATAGPNTRTTQLFINYVDNTFLDAMGFAPFGVVTTGFNTALSIFNPTPGSSGGVDQDQYSKKGNTWIIANYPQINFIEKVSISYDCPVTSDSS